MIGITYKFFYILQVGHNVAEAQEKQKDYYANESQGGQILPVCTRQLCPPEGHEECWQLGGKDGASMDWSI